MAVIDTCGVQSYGIDIAIGYQPFRCLWIQPRKVEFRNRFRTPFGCAEVLLGIRPVTTVPGAKKEDAAIRNCAVCRFPFGQVFGRYEIVGILKRPFGNIDNNRVSIVFIDVLQVILIRCRPETSSGGRQIIQGEACENDPFVWLLFTCFIKTSHAVVFGYGETGVCARSGK